MSRTHGLVVLVLVALGLAGCGYRTRPMGEPVPVRGKVSFADGSPVRGVLLAVQPTGDGHPESFPVGTDGSFSGKLIPGKYVYFVQPSQSRNASEKQQSQESMKRVAAKYQSPSLEHQASFGGSDVEITLSN
jgi:hypothetical protein